MEPQNDMHRLVQSPPEQPSRTAGSQPRLELHGILEGQTAGRDKQAKSNNMLSESSTSTWPRSPSRGTTIFLYEESLA